jgi:hypothetical protein
MSLSIAREQRAVLLAANSRNSATIIPDVARDRCNVVECPASNEHCIKGTSIMNEPIYPQDLKRKIEQRWAARTGNEKSSTAAIRNKRDAVDIDLPTPGLSQSGTDKPPT